MTIQLIFYLVFGISCFKSIFEVKDKELTVKTTKKERGKLKRRDYNHIINYINQPRTSSRSKSHVDTMFYTGILQVHPRF